MLNEEQLEEVRQFMTSPTAELVFQQLQAGTVVDWILAKDLVDRERCWVDLQALLRLQNTLRDATAMKRLDQRAQERRVYTS
jgi:hypothetical protein